MSLLVHENTMTLWRNTIKAAEDRCLISLDDHLEMYLASLLLRYTDKPEVTKRLFAKALLEALDKSEPYRDVLLQRLGDECLLYSGLFPKSAASKLVKINYFVDIGRSAYANISDAASDLFDKLAIQFVVLMDVLQSIRPDTDLLPLEAYEQWQMLGSKRAKIILDRYRHS